MAASELLTVDSSAIDLALARAVVYRTLTIGFQRPTEDGLAKLRSGPARDAFRAAVQLLDRLPRRTKPIWPAATHLLQCPEPSAADLDLRYVHLFGHTARGVVCPYETEYGPDGGFQQPQQLADIAGYYLAFGLKARARLDARVDHVACECEFMDFLCCKEAFLREPLRSDRATHSLDMDTLEQTQKAARHFLRDHLGRFGQAFANQLVRADNDGFFARLGHVLVRCLDFECQLLGVAGGPVTLSLRPDQMDDVPMTCGPGDSLIQIRSRRDYVSDEHRTT